MKKIFHLVLLLENELLIVAILRLLSVESYQPEIVLHENQISNILLGDLSQDGHRNKYGDHHKDQGHQGKDHHLISILVGLHQGDMRIDHQWAEDRRVDLLVILEGHHADRQLVRLLKDRHIECHTNHHKDHLVDLPTNPQLVELLQDLQNHLPNMKK